MALVLHERAQQVELLERERDRLAVDRHRVRRHRERDGPAGKLVVGGDSRSARAAQKRVHAADQLHHAERLRQVVVGAGVEAAHGVELGALGREHHDGHVLRGRFCSQHMEDLEAVDLGQHDVEQHELGQALLAGGEELAGRGEALRVEPGLAQRVHREVADVGVVFNVVDHGSLPSGSFGRFRPL